MDAATLEKLHQHVLAELPHIRSLLVARHGYLVFERYYQGCGPDDNHEVASVTKSFVSTLVGIALKEGYLASLDQRMIDFFPEYDAPALDPRAKAITLRHLLTMTAGFAWFDGDDEFARWVESDNWVAFALGLRVANQPGRRFTYNSPASHLLSAIVARASGMSTLAFAERYLFALLGMRAPKWATDPQGYQAGGYGMAARPRDLAKLGYLYLNGGAWDGRQIVSADWVQQSTRRQSAGGFPEREGYGYLWWVTTLRRQPAFFAGGFGGQFIYVIPRHDIVIAITSNLDRPHMENRRIAGKFVVPAVTQ